MGEGGKRQRLRHVPAEEFVRRLKMDAGQPDVHYALWLGAGCSVSSGIPAAGSLVAERWLPRLRELRGAEGRDLVEWARESFPGYDRDNPAAMYGQVMEELFFHPDARQREIEALCKGRFPGFGYAVLAALLEHDDGLFNVALTPNFDDLIPDAMYVFGEERPLVILDEALAGYIRSARMQPMVVKVHGDSRLSPRNTRDETGKLQEEISENIRSLLHDRGLIFIGYGGNDVGIAEMLEALPTRALPLGVWWASRTEPDGVLRAWLGERDATWVEIPGFDELMLLFKSEFDIPNPASNKFDRIFSNYLNTYGELAREVGQLPDTDPQSPLKDAAARADASTHDWTSVYVRAVREEETNPARAEELYEEGIEEFPRAGMLPLALAALQMWRTRYDDALGWARRAAELEPGSEQALRLYGQALSVTGNQAEGLEVLARAVALRPRDVTTLATHGIELARSGDPAGAERQLATILDLQPSTRDQLGPTALLAEEIGELDRARELYERALVESPEDANLRANLARCLVALGEPRTAYALVALAFHRISKAAVATRLELLFYELALTAGNVPDRTLQQIRSMVEEGDRLPIWNLSAIVAFAEETEHPEAEWVAQLAKVLRKEAEPDSLAAWRRWADAG